MARLRDQAARDAIAKALDDTLVVEAAAGTGKTTELVKRIVRILGKGKARVENIVAVTFTEKAAGELKLRLREALDRERSSLGGEGRASGAVRARLNEALQSLEEAHVSTIHGFCAELLRERPVEARVDPLFAVLTEPQAERLFDDAFGGWLQAQLADPPEGVRRALRRAIFSGFGRDVREDTPVDRLRRAAWDLAQWRDFTEPWMRPPFDRPGDIGRLVAALHGFADLTAHPTHAKDPLFTGTAPARVLSQQIRLEQSLASEDHDGWEARLADLSRDRDFARARHGRGAAYGAGITRDSVVAALDGLKSQLDTFRMDADADLAAALQQDLTGAVQRYGDLKARAGALDFLDLLLKARDLVRGNAGVREGFQRRFSHIFVDEFQDTDPLQAEILLLLASSDPSVTDWRSVTPVPGRLFIVGDPKQSIYRFRRADVGIYSEVCEQLVRSGARPVKLTTSFRSLPQIQACVNAAFAPVMTGDAATLQAAYVKLAPYRSDRQDQPSVIALPVPAPYGSRNLAGFAIEASLPEAVAAFVDWLTTESGWTVTERTGAQPVRAAAKHVCILFRRFVSFGDDITRPYVRALEAHGVSHVLVGGKTFHDREEVETVRAALAAIEWPGDELSVFATLRGALFAIGDEELFEWKHRFQSFHPFGSGVGLQAADPELSHLGAISSALLLLQRLHWRRNDIPIADTIQQLLDATRAHVALVLRPGGEQALANVLHVAELARQYETGGGISFRGFVEELRASADRAQAAEAPILEEGSDGVRIMTVHKAKGLEFPIVILADLTCKLSRVEAGRWLDPGRSLCAIKLGGWSPRDLLLHDREEALRDKAEAERLAYVAATRAQDLLVVPAIGDGPYEGGWLDPLMPAVYPADAARRTPSPAAGCPAFRSKDSVLTRPDDDPAGPSTVAPGAYSFASSDADKYSVVWWDPHILHLTTPSGFGLRRDDLIVKGGDPEAVDQRLADHQRWRDDRAHAIEDGRRPSLRVRTATSWARGVVPLPEGASRVQPVEIVELAGAGGRPRGRRFGTLVHAGLATVALDAPDEDVKTTVETQARVLGASRDEIDGATAVVSAVLRHDLMRRARAASSLKRETPVAWVHQDGTLVEGVMDLAFEEDGRTIVVDFKTDHELSSGAARYRVQVEQYINAVARVTGRPASGVLFRV